MRSVVFSLAVATTLSGCAGTMPFFSELLARAIASPGGLQARASYGKSVHCQTGESGRTDCVEYRTGTALRPGDPVPIGADPYSAPGPSANQTAAPPWPSFPTGVAVAPGGTNTAAAPTPTTATNATAGTPAITAGGAPHSGTTAGAVEAASKSPAGWQAPLVLAPIPLR